MGYLQLGGTIIVIDAGLQAFVSGDVLVHAKSASNLRRVRKVGLSPLVGTDSKIVGNDLVASGPVVA